MDGGFQMRLPAGSHQAWTAAFTGRYDEAEQRLLTSFIEPGSLVLDIGACFGLWTVPLAIAAQRRGGRVVAFEPVPSNAEILRTNIAANGLVDAATVYESALGATSGTATFQVESSQGGNAAVATDSDLEPPGKAEISATVARLDDLGLETTGSAVIKIDVEGFELEALEGASSFVATTRPVILGESNPDWFRARSISATQLAEWVNDHRYVVYRVESERQHPLSDRCIARPLRIDNAIPDYQPLLLVPEDRSDLVNHANSLGNRSPST